MNWLEEAKKRENEIVTMLSDWIKINSVYDEDTIEEKDNKPFGKGVREAFDFILAKSQADGFATVDDDGYACHIDYGEGDSIVGILGHVDVVPEGDGWIHPPFSGKIEDGYLYGRGTQDDKGPVVASYIAMKMIKEMGLPISKKIRMILGGNEEREWKCVKHYFEKYPHPDTGFTPDGDFPLVYGEKEIEVLTYEGEYECETIEIIEGGTAANSVPDYAMALIIKDKEKIKKEFEAFLQEKELKGEAKLVGGGLELRVFGISAHGSTPEKGLNAAAFLLEFLAENTDNAMVKHFYRLFSHYDGRGMGIAFTGDKMGALTTNLGIVDYKHGKFKITLDLRYPLEIDHENLAQKLKESAENEKFKISLKQMANMKGLYLDLESPLLKALTKAYVDQTGDNKTKPMVLGGGTYARATDNIVCYGMLFPESENRMHQKNERVKISELILATAIYAQAIYELAK